ncbi:G6PDH family F420-dependent oxidoreductase [Microbacteriaceae bacterium SG_E_30_P1]|uniref:G6PDH family F420-dependent oxidoreductase n=1 Tax=Antiquaquibacter oligotrophicus TaxID=2880260 RepID=A0ABT6KTL3_9MICO|nr:TIGR03557 family F420-dependent LLM class oxidoreductase [Antiquaquibacter oligotrophicus]MDH6182412.1 G6PDH family F420-dependent oxidoreductase [Antiquaquibacter oligotrophicus]UDF14616.1 TIGR03557 family F420-dependent LLM class oxidoreductase [Antiquaquibacter oligotrophicus]
MQIGYKLATEGFEPKEIIRQALKAEEAGFDFVEMSDHYHPWLDTQGHSGFTWSLFGAIAASTQNLGLVTGVTCPTMRYHPAIIAQAAATMAIISDGRFTLGVGSGENLNEHIIGQGWPVVSRRHAMLREALEIIRLLWQGGYQSYTGTYLQLEDARVFDLPDELPAIAVAASGAPSVALAAELGDGLFAVEPDAELVQSFRGEKSSGPLYGEVALAYAETEEAALEVLMEKERWAVGGWKVMSELPNPVNFDAASATVREDDLREAFAVGPDPEKHLAAIAEFSDAGFDHLVLHNSGPDPDAFFDFYASTLRPRLTT